MYTQILDEIMDKNFSFISDITLNEWELRQYSTLVIGLQKIESYISEVKMGLAELKYSYDKDLSPVLGEIMGQGDKSDKIGKMLVSIESRANQLTKLLETLDFYKMQFTMRIATIEKMVNSIIDTDMRKIIIWYYLEGIEIKEISKRLFIPDQTIYKKINRFFEKKGL